MSEDNDYSNFASYDDNGNVVGGSNDDGGNSTPAPMAGWYDDLWGSYNNFVDRRYDFRTDPSKLPKFDDFVGAQQKAHADHFGVPLNRPWNADVDIARAKTETIDAPFLAAVEEYNSLYGTDYQVDPAFLGANSRAGVNPYMDSQPMRNRNESGFFKHGPGRALLAAAAIAAGGWGLAGLAEGAVGAGLAEGTAAGLAGAGESIMAGGYGANLAASGAGFGAGATGLSLAELGAGSLLGGGAGSVLAGGAGALGLSAETVAALSSLGYSGAEIASMGGNVLNGFDAMQAAASGAGTAADLINDGTWMEDLLGPPQSPAPPSSLMQQLVDAGVPFDLAQYLPSEASLVKTLIQQGLKLANSDGSSRPQVGGLPNYSGGSTNSGGSTSSGGSTNSGGDSYSGAVSGSLGNPFPDAPTSGASPIKAYLQPTGVSTGAPSQSTMYAGLDPKLVNILSQRAAHGGQIHPRLQQVLSDRGYEVNPVEMVAGPEDRYYARHAKRGFAVNGEGTGQSDDIPTMLADGEYVFDSDTVSALGDGSSKAGAAALDKMREEIRKHKRSAPVDKIPPKAKSPLDYMRTVKRVK